MPADPDRPAPDTAPLTSDAPAPDAAPDRPGLRGLVARRWPTLLALVLVARPAWPTELEPAGDARSPRLGDAPAAPVVPGDHGDRTAELDVAGAGRRHRGVRPAADAGARRAGRRAAGDRARRRAVGCRAGRARAARRSSCRSPGLVAYGGLALARPGPRSRGGPVRRRRGLVRARPVGPRPRARRRRSVAIRRGVVRRGRRPGSACSSPSCRSCSDQKIRPETPDGAGHRHGRAVSGPVRTRV